MYILSFFQIFSLKVQNIYIFTRYKKFININAFLCIKNIYYMTFCIIYLENYMCHLIDKVGLLIYLLYFVMVGNSISIIDVNTSNLVGISLYMWLGFRIFNIRFNYYCNESKNTSFISAYNLLSYKFLSKNTLRRYLIFYIK